MIRVEFFREAFDAYNLAVDKGETVHAFALRGHVRGSSDKFHCSQMGNATGNYSQGDKCLRKVILEIAGAEKLHTLPLSARNFNNGKSVEAWLREAIKWGIRNLPEYDSYAAEFNVPVRHPDGDLVGELDVELVDRADDTRTIIDCKSCHEDKLRYGFDEGYRGQVGSYKWLRELAGFKVDYTGVIYITKSTWRTVADFFDAAPHIAGIQRWLDMARAALVRYREDSSFPSEVPMKESKKGGQEPQWVCNPRWCGVCQHCPEKWAYWNKKPWEKEE